MPSGVYLTTTKVAEILEVDRRTVGRWADRGIIPCVLTLGGHRRFRWADVVAYQKRSKG